MGKEQRLSELVVGRRCALKIQRKGREVPGYDRTFRILIVDVARMIYVLSFMDLHAKLSILSILL